jgi:Uncharacterized protein conserved in bacteria
VTALDTTLASLVGSRICHDLISPIGAVNNGLELLSMSGEHTGPEMGLISESVESASARIRFFRVAFGAAGEQRIGPAEVTSVLRHLYGESRLAIQWMPQSPVERVEVQLAFLALLCAETAMPYGGRVDISADDTGWTLLGSADRPNIDAELWGPSFRPKRATRASAISGAIRPAAPDRKGRRPQNHLPVQSRYPQSQLLTRQQTSAAYRSIARDEVFETGQLCRPDRSARMHLARRNPDLRTHPELTPIGKLG